MTWRDAEWAGESCCCDGALTEISIPAPVQGYLAHKKTHTPRTLP